MTRSLQVPYTIRHTIVEVRNSKFLLTNRIPVLLPTGSTGSKKKCFRCGENLQQTTHERMQGPGYHLQWLWYQRSYPEML